MGILSRVYMHNVEMAGMVPGRVRSVVNMPQHAGLVQ
jgi:hypothetical protein